MDYSSYLNQANFDGLSGTAAATNMDHAAAMGYGDLAACGQMTHAAYRFGPAASSMAAARSYNTAMGHHLSAAAAAAAAASGGGNAGGHNGASGASAVARGHHHGAGGHHHQDHHPGRPTMFTTAAMNLPGKRKTGRFDRGPSGP